MAGCRSVHRVFLIRMSVGRLAPERMVRQMAEHGLHRGYVVWDSLNETARVSHPLFDTLAGEMLANARDYNKHEGVFFEVGRRSGALMSTYIHKTLRGQAQGGVRFWSYADVNSMVVDGLRLSEGMGRKNALAGLWWGGGKGIIHFEPHLNRVDAFKDYGSFVTSLRGCYLGAEDAGTVPTDVETMFSTSRFITCIPPSVGGSGNPSDATGLGVVCAMEGALDFLGMGDCQGKTVAIQGAGNVSRFMAKHLLQRGVAHIAMTDIQEASIATAMQDFGQDNADRVSIQLVEPADQSIMEKDVDIFAPCALGGVLNPDTIPRIRAPIISGAANNQLLDTTRDDKLLQEHGKTYVPDFLANRMGIVKCANEQYGFVTDDEVILRHFGREWPNSIFVKTKEVLQLSKDHNISSSAAAITIADELMKEPHPIWGHRAAKIIESLLQDRWEKQSRL